MAIPTLGSLPKTAYEVWLAAQATSSMSSSRHSTGLSWHLAIVLNAGMLLLMVMLCIVAKRRYDDMVDKTDAIPARHKVLMRHRISLRGYNAGLKRSRSVQPLLSTEEHLPAS